MSQDSGEEERTWPPTNALMIITQTVHYSVDMLHPHYMLPNIYPNSYHHRPIDHVHARL
jgi:hypothetical protein